ncbi:MAG: hypothetical protein ACRD9R_01430 [Pyrinomonadaceae bacterium]
MQLNEQVSSDLSLQPIRADQKIEVLLEQQDGEFVFALCYSTWTDGLGWCRQKTLRLQVDQLEDLQRALTVARHRVIRQRADAGEQVSTAQVIKFPSLA